MAEVVLVQAHHAGERSDGIESTREALLEMPPLGLCYLAAVLKREGYSVEVVDFNVISDDVTRARTIERIVNSAPAIVGIGAMTPAYHSAVQIADQVRRALGSKTKILMGGHHVSHLPEAPLRSLAADVVIRGEAEEVIVRLAGSILSGAKDSSLSEIGGISFVDRNGGIIHNNPPGILRVRDLDALPFPDRDVVSVTQYRNPGTICSARGCPARCLFCAAGAWGSISCRSPENVVAELEILTTKYGFKHLFFVDNAFITNRERTVRILALMKERGIRVSFSVETRAGSVDEELVRAMSEGGCIAIQFGVESGNPEVLRHIGKDTTLEEGDRGVELCLEHNIRPLCSFIVGHPFDTKETVRDTINYAKKLKRQGASIAFALLEVYPGTELFNRRDCFGVAALDFEFSWSEAHNLLHTKHLSWQELHYLYQEAISEVWAI